VAGNKGPRSHSRSITPPPTGVGRRMERKRQKHVGWDKGSLPEQKTKQTVTAIIMIRRIYKTNSKMHRATLTAQCTTRFRAATHFPSSQLTNQDPA